MLNQGTILVPLDGSALSERSLPYAAALSRALKSKLALMIAAYISDIPAHGPWSGDMVDHPRETSMAYLSDVATRIGMADVEKIARVGYPHEMILEVAEATKASMIVMSTHGRSGVGRWLYGSTAGHLMHAARVPLFVVGKDVPDAAEYAPARIVVPLDGSPLAETALAPAQELAKAFEAKLTLARVAPFSAESFSLSVPQAYWPQIDEELFADATRYLEKVRESLDHKPDVKVVQGPRAELLLDVVEGVGADLVVMTTHGRAGVQRALLGSTADRMLQGSAPVLLIRPD